MLIDRRAFLALAGVGSSLAYQRVDAAQALTAGQHALGLAYDRDGLLYLPRGYTPGVAAPLVVLLHGAGGSAYSASARFPLADEFGFIILAPDSRDGRTWDLLLTGFGPDAEFITAALKSALSRCSVDRRRMALAGSSDGATCALSLGIAMGDVFSHLIAFSPAMVLPPEVRGKPRIFISHGTNDEVMPIDKTSRDIVRRLKALGYDVTYREFEGGHTVPPEIARDGFEWFLG